VGLQVHGAIGYTWEQDLHIWMRRAWSLGLAWGDDAFHRRRIADAILADGARLGPGETYAVSPRRPHLVTNGGETSATFLVLQGIGEYDYVPLT